MPFIFDSWLGAAASFILVVSHLNVFMRDETVKLNEGQVSCLKVRNTESLSEVAINDIYQAIEASNNLLDAFVGKLRKLLDCEEVRRNMRADVIDEAHLIAEWQAFNIFHLSKARKASAV